MTEFEEIASIFLEIFDSKTILENEKFSKEGNFNAGHGIGDQRKMELITWKLFEKNQMKILEYVEKV